MKPLESLWKETKEKFDKLEPSLLRWVRGPGAMSISSNPWSRQSKIAIRTFWSWLSHKQARDAVEKATEISRITEGEIGVDGH